MKIKIDENLGSRGAIHFRNAGHDVATVPEERLEGSADRNLISVCREEGRCLVTLDLDFANPILFCPREYPGIAVLRLPAKAEPVHMERAVQTLLVRLEQADVTGKLWIVEQTRVREYQPEEDDES